MMDMIKLWPYLAFALVLLTVLIVVVVRRCNDGGGTSSVNLAKLNNALSELNIKFADLSSNALTGNNKRIDEIQRLHSRIVRIEDFLLEMTCGTGHKGSFADVCKKKPSGKRETNVALKGLVSDHVAAGEQAGEQTDDEEQASASLFAQKSTIQAGLIKTRDRIFAGLSTLFGKTTALNSDFYEGLEEVLISSDLGVGTATMVIERVKQEASRGEQMNEGRVVGILKNVIADILSNNKSKEFYALSEAVNNRRPVIIMMVGVNGVGKTTTVGKFASYFSDKESKVLVVAADTFRAAAVSQLQIWGQRSNVTVLFDEHGRKASTVVFEAIKKMKQELHNVMLIDTAGRLNNKSNLMSELEGLGRLIKKEHPDALLEVILVVDAATGQNALQQARDFHQSVHVNSVVITKLDGTPKGGIVVAIKNELGIPIRFVGVGEKLEDLKPFSVNEFVDGLISTDYNTGGHSNGEHHGGNQVTRS